MEMIGMSSTCLRQVSILILLIPDIFIGNLSERFYRWMPSCKLPEYHLRRNYPQGPARARKKRMDSWWLKKAENFQEMGCMSFRCLKIARETKKTMCIKRRVADSGTVFPAVELLAWSTRFGFLLNNGLPFYGNAWAIGYPGLGERDCKRTKVSISWQLMDSNLSDWSLPICLWLVKLSGISSAFGDRKFFQN